MASSALPVFLTVTLVAGLMCLNGVQTKNKTIPECPPQFPLQSAGGSDVEFCCSNKCPNGTVGERCKIEENGGEGVKSCPDGEECYTDIGNQGICCPSDPCPTNPSKCPVNISKCQSHGDCQGGEKCCACIFELQEVNACISI